MSSTRLRDPKHVCHLGYPEEGEIRRCDDCHRTWLGRRPPNPDYHRWVALTWLGRKLRRLP